MLRSAALTVAALSAPQDAKVYPVCVWAAESSAADVRPGSGFFRHLQRQGQSKIDAATAKIKMSRMSPLRILFRTSFSVRQEAQELVNYAKSVGAEMIVLSSRGRKGLKRWALGSFAETLTLCSDVPLMIVHPNQTKRPSFKTILFPTDLSAESQEAFERVLDFAQEHRSRVVVFHKAPSTSYPLFGLGAAAYVGQYEIALNQAFVENQRTAKSWAQQGRSRGLKVDVVIDSKRVGSAAVETLKHAKRLGAMIAMASRSGPISAVVLGSTTRQVVRNAELPVWVIHPKLKQEQRVEPIPAVPSKGVDQSMLEREYDEQTA